MFFLNDGNDLIDLSFYLVKTDVETKKIKKKLFNDAIRGVVRSVIQLAIN